MDEVQRSTVEQVVLLDEHGHPSGTAPKATVHRTVQDGGTPLHLAFSCHVVDSQGRLLMTRRALGKVAFPGVWTNAFCGHPGPGEELEAAIRRRARQELGLDLVQIWSALPDFAYRAADAAGMEENEVCPVFMAQTEQAEPVPDPEEADDWAWVTPADLRSAVTATPFAFSPWMNLQVNAGVLDNIAGQGRV
ncbi:isopentenyl-diphosphate Delta-isomerase [Micrococcus terreus]|uniref:isopentenyl-diphosphate Delta-isomerase n=1 Tax=Micrococcus terreus TaxID=574650 RepID=UPI00254A670D|nr:isopentenyl-diphosphate Delta-isomerase [Micrococcus terreus]MDK7701073.1 isopentenyl-diphosphate Delta-isomerase [Micrococcus terreus]WOO96831.1 isopentenyl-diphosphate Delta-isomerase [Micrococcus terreus]